MGLAGLYKFVNTFPELLTERRLRDTKIVIDGHGLLRQLYENLDSKFGGEYIEYRKRCVTFFDNLRQCDITPYVVFDGAWDPDDRKYKTYLKRHRQKLLTVQCVSSERGWQRNKMIIPVFALHILQNVAAKTEGVFTITADFEADEEIIALANHFECPAVAFDNDFFVYPLIGGYITFHWLKWQQVETVLEAKDGSKRQKTQYISATIFLSQDELCKKIGITKDKLPLFATIRGNDYLETDTLKLFNDHVKLPFGGQGIYVLGDWMKNRQDKTTEDILTEVLDILNLPKDRRREVETLAKECMQVFSGASAVGYLIDVFGHVGRQNECESTASSKMPVASSDHNKDQEESSTSSDWIVISSWSPEQETSVETSTKETQPTSSAHDQSIPSSSSTKRKVTMKCRYENLGLPTKMIEHLRKGTLHSMWVNVFVKGEFIGLKQMEAICRYCSANDVSKDIRAAMYGILLGSEKFKTVKEYDRKKRTCKVAENVVTVPQELPHYGKLPSLDSLDVLARDERKRLLLAVLDITSPFPDFEEHLQLPLLVTRYWFKRSRFDTHYIVRGLILGFLLYADEVNMEVFSRELEDVHDAIKDALQAYAEWQSCLVYVNDLNVLLDYPMPRFDISLLFSGKKTHQLAELTSNKYSKVINVLLAGCPSLDQRYKKVMKFVEKK